MNSFNLLAHSIPRHNLVDLLWENRTEIDLRKIVCLSLNECGEESLSKIERVRERMKKAKCDSIILTALDDIACNLFHFIDYQTF